MHLGHIQFARVLFLQIYQYFLCWCICCLLQVSLYFPCNSLHMYVQCAGWHRSCTTGQYPYEWTRKWSWKKENNTCFIKLWLADSLEQNICWYKTSFHPTTAGLHQVWGRTEMLHLIYVLGGSMHMLRQGCSKSMLHRTCENCIGALGLA